MGSLANCFLTMLPYFLTPILAWCTAGALKFIINSIGSKRLAFDLVGYGGFPSNHAAIVSSTTSLIAIREGFNSPAFGIAITLAFIVILDANNLRWQLGQHAKRLNEISRERPANTLLRESIGHTKTEILAGIVVGIAVSLLADISLN